MRPSRIDICMVCNAPIHIERQNSGFITCGAECERMFYIGKKLNGLMDELINQSNRDYNG